MALVGVTEGARISLAVIRIINGALGLIAPRLLIGRIDPDEPASPAAVYAFRLFGIRTVLIGRDLLFRRGDDLQRSLDEAPLVHGSDTVTATLLTVNGHVSRRSGIILVAISATNTLLAILARRSRG